MVLPLVLYFGKWQGCSRGVTLKVVTNSTLPLCKFLAHSTEMNDILLYNSLVICDVTFFHVSDQPLSPGVANSYSSFSPTKSSAEEPREITGFTNFGQGPSFSFPDFHIDGKKIIQ